MGVLRESEWTGQLAHFQTFPRISIRAEQFRSTVDSDEVYISREFVGTVAGNWIYFFCNGPLLLLPTAIERRPPVHGHIPGDPVNHAGAPADHGLRDRSRS